MFSDCPTDRCSLKYEALRYSVPRRSFNLVSFCLCVFHVQPERIDPPDPSKPDYDIRADVWSLGISLVRFVLASWNCSHLFYQQKWITCKVSKIFELIHQTENRLWHRTYVKIIYKATCEKAQQAWANWHRGWKITRYFLILDQTARPDLCYLFKWWYADTLHFSVFHFWSHF